MTKVVLYNAISADGFIAGEHDETPWSDEEWMAFQDFVKSCDVCLLGRRTYEIMRLSGEFIAEGHYLVVTSDQNADTAPYKKVTIRSSDDLPKVDKIGLIGGGELNGSLAELGCIDEMILDLESVILGRGTRLFGSHNVTVRLKLLSSTQLGPSFIQNRYEVMK